MDYVVINRDFGQGEELTALPVAGSRNFLDSQKENTVYDVLVKGYGEDLGLVLKKYIEIEKDRIQQAGILRGSQRLRLLSYVYRLTDSRIQQPVNETVVDFIFRVTLEGDGGRLAAEDFRIRYILDMRPCAGACIGPLIFPCREEETVLKKYRIRTNEFLLPILYEKDYEWLAHEIISRYFPEDPERLDAQELARRMGLRVWDVHFKDRTILGQIYYDFSNTELLDDNGNSYTARIPPGTILISRDNCSAPAVRSSTIAHECSHMYLDRWYFLLQMMGGARSPYTSRKKDTGRRKFPFRKKTAMEWMELQCEKMPAYILMERDSTKKYIEKLLAGRRDPAAVRNAVVSLANHCKVSRSMAKYRMIELGFQEAEGVFGYINGKAVPDHGCSAIWPKGVTYTIPVQDLAVLLEANLEFEAAMKNGRYIYVEGHVCLNRKKYIYSDRAGVFFLTPYARRHIDECSIAFRSVWRYREGAHHQGGAARRKTKPVADHYCSRYQLEAAPDDVAYSRENRVFFEDSMLWGEYYYEMSDDFQEAVRDIMKKKGITQEKLSFELGVDRKVIYSFLNSQGPSLEHLVGICVALKLPYFVSMKLLQNAGVSLRRMELHHRYRQFLIQADVLSVERCNDILKEKKYPPLFNGKNSG